MIIRELKMYTNSFLLREYFLRYFFNFCFIVSTEFDFKEEEKYRCCSQF